MKRYFYIICAMLIGIFASCSKSELGSNEVNSTEVVTLKVSTNAGVTTRATSVKRFAIEVYTDATYETKANVFEGGTTHKAENATGEFAMLLDCTVEYYCLLWADNDDAGVYDITSLKAVTLTGKAAEAWHGTAKIDAAATAILSATIDRAVSKVTLKENGQLHVGDLKLNFNQPNIFNVATGLTSGSEARPEESVTVASSVDGAVTPVILNVDDIFILSSVTTADLTDFTFKFRSEAPFTVPQVPLKANNNTNIIGHYTSSKHATFTVSYNADWQSPDIEEVVPKAKVGDYYYAGNTFSSTIQPGKKCIGIVFWVDPTDATKGKVVSLDEPVADWNGLKNPVGCLPWSATYPYPRDPINANDMHNGLTNMATVKALDADYSEYQAFAWCAAKTDGGKTWYLPSCYELHQLCAAIAGYVWVESGADTSKGEINEWEAIDIKPNFNTDACNDTRNAFNAILEGVGGTKLVKTNTYWSSTEKTRTSAYNSYLLNGTTQNGGKNNGNRVRAITTF